MVAVVGLITEPTPPNVPSLMVGVYANVKAVCCASAIVVLQDNVKGVDMERVWRWL